MHIIPLFKVQDMGAAIRYYTEVPDFLMTWPQDTADSPVVDLEHEQPELQLTTHESERLFCSVAYVWVEDVERPVRQFKARGLDTSPKSNSPVHQGPVD